MNPHNNRPTQKHEKGAERLPIVAQRESILSRAEYTAQSVKSLLGLDVIPVSKEVFEHAAKPEKLAATYPDIEQALNEVYADSPAHESPAADDNRQDLDIGEAQDAVDQAFSEEVS